MNDKKRYFVIKDKGFLLISITIIYLHHCFFAILNRDINDERNYVRLVLFQGYIEPIDNSFRDLIINIVGFIPIGLLIGMMSEKYRFIKALIVGFLFSLIIEFSQLICKRGTFDVDDLFNNTLGALIGGVIVVMVLRIQKMTTQKDLI